MKIINKKSDPKFYRPFLWILIVLSLVVLYFLFRPFLVEIIIAASLSSVFFGFYEKTKKIIFGKKYISALLMCLALLFIIIIPTILLVAYAASKAPEAYSTVNQILSDTNISEAALLERFNISVEYEENVKDFIADSSLMLTEWIISSTTIFIKGTTNFLISLFIILITMFFFFVNGKEIVRKLIFWSPLPNKYDIEIANKFRRISYNTVFSLFAAAVVQGTLSALGLLVVGWPFLFTFIISAFLSIIPYMLGLFFVPIIIYLLIDGQIWQAVFITVWNLIIVVNLDELVRAYIIKGKEEVNMMIMVFALLGGIFLFGFWGVFIGPIILALALSVIHIYELEFSKQLDKS